MPIFKSLPLVYESTDVYTYEVKKDPLSSTPETPVKERRTNDGLRNWVSAVPSVSGRPIAAHPLLRLIHLQCDNASNNTAKANRRFRVSLTESLCKDICKAWALPVDLDEWLREISDRIISPIDSSSAGTVNQRCYVFNSKSDTEDRHSALLIVKHTADIPLTTAILSTARPIDEIDLNPFLNIVLKASTNPMAIPAALADAMITLEASGTNKIDDTLGQLEKDREALLGSASTISSSTGIVDRTARILDDVRVALGRSERRLQGLRLLFNASTQYMQELRSAMPNQRYQREAEDARRILEALINNLRSDVEQLLLQLQNNNVRVQTQQQLVYNVMTTREAISARLIATVGMRDGAAMKALALLTMVFLPGTFVSTIFSMPVVDWPSLKLPIGAFALYWLVSIFSTILVLSAWALWMHFNERRHSRRFNLGSKVA